jgi:hypothetical protein
MASVVYKIQTHDYQPFVISSEPGERLAAGWTNEGSEFESRWGLHIVQTGSGAHPASCLMGTAGNSPGGKVDHSPPPSTEVKKT